MKRATIFWPGDYRPQPNEWALPYVVEATQQLQQALRKLGWQSHVLRCFLTKPSEAIDQLGPVDEPMIGVFTHWTYGPHTCDGVLGKDNPLLLASNFSGLWPGLVALLNTAACLESLNRPHSRIWTSAIDWSEDETFMARLEQWCKTGSIDYDASEFQPAPRVGPEAQARADRVVAEIRRKRILALMLGDTSMGMINGYFGPRVLAKHGFAEHKVDQAWLPWHMKELKSERVEDAFRFVRDQGVAFHWEEEGATDFTADTTRTQLAMYLAVMELLGEFNADCLGWQYQLGLWPILPPSDFCEGLLNSVCRPESDGDVVITATEADQGSLVPMELMKRILADKGLHHAVMSHDVRWGDVHDGRWLWVLLNSGSCGAYAFNHDPDSLRGVHSYRQPAGYFPVAGGTFAGESLPGKITWARSYLKKDVLWMDIGRGEAVKLPPAVRDAWWEGTTRQWPFMAADLGCSMETIMAHYMSNHIAVAYGDILEELVAVSLGLGLQVRILRAE